MAGRKAPPAEAPEDAIYGKYLFPQNRYHFPNEPNTKPENKLQKALEDHFVENSSSKLDKIAPEVLDVLAKHQYEPLLEPGNQKVFRVIGFPVKQLIKLVEMSGNEFARGSYESCQLEYVLKPKSAARPIQSWTSKLFKSKNLPDLLLDGLGDGNGAVVFVTYPHKGNNKFFGKPHDLANVVDPDFAEEYETISFGPVEYVGFSYIVPEDDDEDFYEKFSYRKLATAALGIG
jgi:hypothetical protein